MIFSHKRESPIFTTPNKMGLFIYFWCQRNGPASHFKLKEPEQKHLTSILSPVWVNLKTMFCLLVAKRPSNMLVYLRNGSAQTIGCAATLRWKLQIKISISPSLSVLTPGQAVPSLTLYRQTRGRAASGVHFWSLVSLDPGKFPRQKRDSNPDQALSGRAP